MQTALAFILPFFLLTPAYADVASWKGPSFKPPILHAGGITCRQQVDFQKTIISCTHKGKLLFEADDFADYLAVSDDGRFIVGLSNRGMTNAFWIRDRQGKLIHALSHDDGWWLLPSPLHYCERSITNIRIWFDKKTPNVEFTFQDNELQDVTVMSCNGKKLHLFYY